VVPNQLGNFILPSKAIRNIDLNEDLIDLYINITKTSRSMLNN